MKIKPFLPLLLFVALFLGLGLYYQGLGVPFAFYQIPAPVAALPAVILALILAKGKFDHRIETFIKGMGDNNVISMCLIYLLAGAFSAITKSTGPVEAAVNFGLSITPLNFVLPAIFILSSILSLAMGTSMGTISAIGPIALGISQMTGLSGLHLFGALIGGAMFGDNLSVISDTTIAATRTQGVKMSDKFKANLKLALPAALLTIFYLYLQSTPVESIEVGAYSITKLLPYVLLLLLALMGVNVFIVLFVGIISAGLVAIISLENFSFITFSKLIFDGFKEMQEIFILSMIMGGLGQMMKEQNGINLIKDALKRMTLFLGRNESLHRFFTELGLALSVTLANLCVANNTVAILICGDFFKEVARTESISPRRSASILDIFSCITQGMIPYGAQILLASQLAGIGPLELSLNVVYCQILAFVVILNMLYRSRLQARGSTD
ncbi:MAG TPA: Na+/H+ antiporter NhaC family protein [Bacteriovoracaceae bacterium]|nr:Na+/H+ antiporter NhaC family protein [Bacteriovoracaceae bacterium]